MPQFFVDEWEYNGRDDSDFYVLWWDSEAGTCVREEVGTTRFAGGIKPVPPESRAWPEVEVERCREWVRQRLVSRLGTLEAERINEPGSFAKGDAVEFLAEHTSRKDSVTAKKGDTGRVFWTGHYGTFYRNGYNRPGRHNLRVGVRLADGSSIFVPASKLKLDEEPDVAGIERKAAQAVAGEGFRGAAYSFFATAEYRFSLLGGST